MNRKGQFIVAGAIMIAAFMFALMLAMSQMNVQRQALSPEPVDEVVLAVSSDFKRSLQAAFARASQVYWKNYLEGKDVAEAQQLLNSELQRWLEATSSAYSGYGLRIALASGNGSNFYGEFYWSGNPGISRVYATFEMDVESYGLRGLALTKFISLRLNISEVKVNSTEGWAAITTKFKVDEDIGGGRSLTPSIKGVEAIVGGKRIDSDDIELSYLGQGVYSATFNVESPNVEEITLAVTTEDNIVVAAKKSLAREARYLDEWRTFFLIPGKVVIEGKRKVDYFYLSRNPTEPSEITPQISYGPPSRIGVSNETLPSLSIGPVTITLYARATSKDIPLNVTLGYELDGLHIIGNGTTIVAKSNNYIPYKITIETSMTIPEGSKLVLILERIDEEPRRGTLHILTGQEYSRIELWPQP